MRKYFIANIKWISFEKGGRKTLPREGTRYCPLVRMYKDNDVLDWSIDFICPNFYKTNSIKFKFLVENAPTDLIEKDMKYGIYEGSKHVAEIRIVDIVE